tara:strand:+ start:26092 stop:26889 length:798 start_codon:yes stop_codon:yes gene_type:complete
MYVLLKEWIMYQMSHYQPTGSNYSPLEQISSQAVFYSAAAPISYELERFNPIRSFVSSVPSYHETRPSSYNSKKEIYQIFTPTPEYHFQPDNFLIPGKEGKFVGKAEEVRDFIEEAFSKIFGQTLPSNIKISLLDEKKFSKIAPSPGVLGLSINRNKFGLLSEVFVKNDFLARVMLTMGHELGHVLSETLSDSISEEAKAYAFSLMWMDVIKEHNIAGLADAFVTENPARNGLHDVAWEFVCKMKLRMSVKELYGKLRDGFCVAS